jgi:hypothetical protein
MVIVIVLCSLQPWLYAWLNENFRKEFKQVLPCFSSSQNAINRSSRRFVSQRTCNGNDTVQETLMPPLQANQSTLEGGSAQAGTAPNQGALETIDEQVSDSQTPIMHVNYQEVTAKYFSTTNQVEIHIPSCVHQQSDTESVALTAPSSAT